MRLFPRFVEGHFGLAQALVHKQQVSEAVAAMRGALAVDANNFFAHLNVGQLLLHSAQADPVAAEEAVHHLQRAVALDPEDASARSGLQAGQGHLAAHRQSGRRP